MKKFKVLGKMETAVDEKWNRILLRIFGKTGRKRSG